MLGSAELMELHRDALFTRDAGGRLVSVNEPGGGQAPRFFLGRTGEGCLCSVRGDVGERLARELGSLATVPGPVATDATSAQTEAGPFLEALAADSPIRRSWIGPAFAFQDRLATSDAVEITTANASLLRPYLVEWLEDVSEEVPMCVSLVEGRAVSICCSVRATDGAHEAGVETHPRFRRRGHAARAVLGWAVAVRIRGLEPLYSTSWENEASLGLAAALGLLQYGADLHVT